MGQPKSVKPSSVIGIPAGKEPRSKLASFEIEKRHLLLLRWRPREGPTVSMISWAEKKALGGPQREPSSRYHTLRQRLGTLD